MEPTPLRQNRQSASARKALEAEIERVRRMSIEDRIKAALSMRSRFEWLRQEGNERRR